MTEKSIDTARMSNGAADENLKVHFSNRRSRRWNARPKTHDSDGVGPRKANTKQERRIEVEMATASTLSGFPDYFPLLFNTVSET